MPGVTTSNGSRAVRRLLPLLVVAALLAAVPLAGSPGAATIDRGARRDALDRAHTFAVADSVATAPAGQDRRDAPVGPTPALAIATLLALAGTVVVCTRRLGVERPRVSFRRRAPPHLLTAS
jgi:hypothetical protein